MSILNFKENFLSINDEASPELIRRKKKIIRTYFFEKKAPSSPKAAPKINEQSTAKFPHKKKDAPSNTGIPRRAPKVKCLKDIPELHNKSYEYNEEEESRCSDIYMEQDSFMPLQPIENTVDFIEERKKTAVKGSKKEVVSQKERRSSCIGSEFDRKNALNSEADKEAERLKAEREMLHKIIAEQKKIIGSYLEKSQKKPENPFLTDREVSLHSEAYPPEKAIREFTNISGYNSNRDASQRGFEKLLFQDNNAITKSPDLRSDSGIIEEASVRRHLSFTDDDGSVFGKDRESFPIINQLGFSVDLNRDIVAITNSQANYLKKNERVLFNQESFTQLDNGISGTERSSIVQRVSLEKSLDRNSELQILKEKINDIFKSLSVISEFDQVAFAEIFQSRIGDCKSGISDECLDSKLDIINKVISNLFESVRNIAGRELFMRNQLKLIVNQNKIIVEENKDLQKKLESTMKELQKTRDQKNEIDRRYNDLRNNMDKSPRERSKTEGPEGRQTHPPPPESIKQKQHDSYNFRSGLSYSSTNKDQNKEIFFYNAIKMVNNFYSQKLSLIFETLNNPEKKEENARDLLNVDISSNFVDKTSGMYQEIMSNLQILEHIHNRIYFLILESGHEAKKNDIINDILKKIKGDDGSFALGSDEDECEQMFNTKSKRTKNKLFSQRQLSTILKLDEYECESTDRFQVEPFVKLLNEKETQLEAIQKREVKYQNTIGSLNRELRRIRSLIHECPDSDLFGRLGHPEENITAEYSKPVIQFDNPDLKEMVENRRENRYFMDYSVEDFDFHLNNSYF